MKFKVCESFSGELSVQAPRRWSENNSWSRL